MDPGRQRPAHDDIGDGGVEEEVAPADGEDLADTTTRAQPEVDDLGEITVLRSTLGRLRFMTTMDGQSQAK